MDGGTAGGNAGVSPAPFLLKTYEMVDDATTDDVVSWSENRKSCGVEPARVRPRPPSFILQAQQFLILNTYDSSTHMDSRRLIQKDGNLVMKILLRTKSTFLRIFIVESLFTATVSLKFLPLILKEKHSRKKYISCHVRNLLLKETC